MFSASSSGLQYALAAYWRRAACCRKEFRCRRPRRFRDRRRQRKLLARDGGADRLGARQRLSVERLELPRALDVRTREAEIERVVGVAVDALEQGVSPLVFSAEGPTTRP